MFAAIAFTAPPYSPPPLSGSGTAGCAADRVASAAMSDGPTPERIARLRSRAWFDNPAKLDMTALYLERTMNYGLSPR